MYGVVAKPLFFYYGDNRNQTFIVLFSVGKLACYTCYNRLQA